MQFIAYRPTVALKLVNGELLKARRGMTDCNRCQLYGQGVGKGFNQVVSKAN